MKIKPVPYDDLVERFGPPCSRRGMVVETLPFPMVASWDNSMIIKSFYGHEYIADSVLEAFEEIKTYYGLEFIRENHLDEYGGCFAERKARGLDRWSVHAWGLAIDYLPSLGPLGKPSMMPHPVVEAFTKRGFLHGGYWPRKDSMHLTSVIE